MIGIDQFLDKGCRVKVHPYAQGAPEGWRAFYGTFVEFLDVDAVLVRTDAGDLVRCPRSEVYRSIEPAPLPEKPIAPRKEP